MSVRCEIEYREKKVDERNWSGIHRTSAYLDGATESCATAYLKKHGHDDREYMIISVNQR